MMPYKDAGLAIILKGPVLMGATAAGIDEGGVGPGSRPNGEVPKVQVPEPGGSPGKGWVWKGSGETGGQRGNWVNEGTNERLRWDPHEKTYGPHWDYTDASGARWRVFPDGKVQRVGGR